MKRPAKAAVTKATNPMPVPMPVSVTAVVQSLGR
jgi:hypothetical protein